MFENCTCIDLNIEISNFDRLTGVLDQDSAKKCSDFVLKHRENFEKIRFCLNDEYKSTLNNFEDDIKHPTRLFLDQIITGLPIKNFGEKAKT